MSKYVLKNDHPLIPREQTFSVNRKLITVHSEDRDINKWPNANHFELQLPQTYTNVETIALVEYSFPTYYYTFSNESQNTKITFTANVSMGSYGQTDPIVVTISPGFYSPTQLAAELHMIDRRAGHPHELEASGLRLALQFEGDLAFCARLDHLRANGKV